MSISMALFVLVSLLHKNLKDQIRNFFLSPLLWGMSVLFFLPFISGIWSEDKKQWLDIMRIKLPLLFMPIAFASPFGLSKKNQIAIVILFIILVTGGTLWSTVGYISDINAAHENYLRSQLIITPLENNHILFSWIVTAAILFSAGLLWQKKESGKKTSRILLITILWLIIFLHILAARTGLISFYTILFVAGLWFILKKSKLVYGVLLLAVFIVLPLAAYFVFPTFQNRVKYFLYDLPYFSKASYKPRMNDAVRIISMKAGWSVMNDHPAAGAGFGDIFNETTKWYRIHYPEMIEKDKIYPSGEWLMYGAGCGWPGFFLFSIVLLIPFFIKKLRQNLLWHLLNATIAMMFLFDTGLEVQFGVFIYTFILLCFWHWRKEEASYNIFQ